MGVQDSLDISLSPPLSWTRESERHLPFPWRRLEEGAVAKREREEQRTQIMQIVFLVLQFSSSFFAEIEFGKFPIPYHKSCDLRN